MKGWLLAAALGLLAATAIGSFWFGTRWQQGRDAIAQLGDAKATVQAAAKQISDYNTMLHASTTQFQDNADALRAIAEDFANGNAQRQQFAAALGARVDTYLAQHPAIAGCDLGPDGLKLWNDANQGALGGQRVGPTAAGAQDRSVAAGAVPGAAAGLIWQIGRAAAQPRAGGGPVPRVPGAAGQPFQGGARAPAARDRPAAVGLGILGHSRAALIQAAGGQT